MCPLRNIGTAIVFLVAVDAASLCAWTSDDATKQWPSGWRDGLRSLHDLLRCEGYNKAARPLPGTIAELLQALEMEDDGTDAGIDRQRLKRRYRDLSVKHHPDKTRDSARFQKLRDAYEILEDPVKILLYDTGGMELLRKYEASSDALPVTESLELLHHVDLEDAYSGGSFKLAYTRQVVCLSCRLQPRLQRCRGCRPCPDIIEHQQVWVSPFEYYVKEIRLPSPERCRRRSESLDLPIERGVSFGQRLLFEMQADQRPQHVPGDLLVTLQMKRHQVFKKGPDGSTPSSKRPDSSTPSSKRPDGSTPSSKVMQVTNTSRHELLKKLSSSKPEDVRSLMRSIDTEKMMEFMSRRSVDDIADMMETNDEEEEEADGGETPAASVSQATLGQAEHPPALASAAPATDTSKSIRERGQHLARMVASGDKEGVKNYILTEPVDDMWQITLDMEEWQSAGEQKQMDKDFNKLIPGKEFAALLRQRPELKKFVQQMIKREMQKKIASLTGRKKK